MTTELHYAQQERARAKCFANSVAAVCEGNLTLWQARTASGKDIEISARVYVYIIEAQEYHRTENEQGVGTSRPSGKKSHK